MTIEGGLLSSNWPEQDFDAFGPGGARDGLSARVLRAAGAMVAIGADVIAADA